MESIHVIFADQPHAVDEGENENASTTMREINLDCDGEGDTDNEDNDEDGGGDGEDGGGHGEDGGDEDYGNDDDGDDGPAGEIIVCDTCYKGFSSDLDLETHSAEAHAVMDCHVFIAKTYLIKAFTSTSASDPTTIVEALDSPQAQEWLAAMHQEFASLEENGTWTVVPRSDVPRGTRPLQSKLVFKTKLGADGDVEKYKARLVVKGFAQRRGIEYDQVFAPVAHLQTIRLLLSMSASAGVPVHQMDVKTAFLNPPIDETIFMEIPDGLELDESVNRRDFVCRLNKALYGLKQAPRAWNKLLDNWLTRVYGMTRSSTDPCLYFKHLPGLHPLIVVVWFTY